jgi:xylan 1,4-beta-xylosidase
MPSVQAMQLSLAILALAFSTSILSAASLEIVVDGSDRQGEWRALHGVNRGPLVAGGLINLTNEHRLLNIPFTRLHDAHWPNSDVVDIHAVFPDFARDPERAESYDFARTDEYITAIRATGADIVYRLGESIEHERVRKWVHPPADPQKWARICLGIIRHYNEGWADGFRHGIRYWEIWNEPENRPVCWTGTDEEFLRLYATAARAIKAAFPQLKVGGPGFGYTGDFTAGQFRVGGLITNFLAACRREQLPLDFLSWHCYTDDPEELVIRARGIRRLLDDHGFQKTESHLNEWNYLPGRTWTPISKSKGTPQSRRAFYQQMAGAPGAAFIVGSLIRLQDAPLDMANLFHAETAPFGLFDVNGVPEKNYFAVRAWAEFLHTPQRLKVTGTSNVVAAAGRDASGSQVQVLLSYSVAGAETIRVRGVQGMPALQARVVDASHDFAPRELKASQDGAVTVPVSGPAVVLLSFRKGAVR